MKAKLLVSLMLLLVTNCIFDNKSDKPKLDTTAHSVTDAYQGEGQIHADYSWRFISYDISTSTSYAGIFVDGAWNIKLRNTSSSKYQVIIKEFTFEDKDGFQIALDILFDDPTAVLNAGESVEKQGDFRFNVASVTIANSITDMNPWLIITEQ